MSIDIPDFIPQLRRGLSQYPSQGGCLVQIANWLADPSTWTDRPLYVDPRLAAWGIRINDSIGDESRRKLALAAARISGTQDMLDEPGKFQQWIDANQPYVKIDEKCPCGCGAAMSRYFVESDFVDWYFRLIDEFDRIVGRDSDVVQPEQRFRELAAIPQPEPVEVGKFASGGIVVKSGVKTGITSISLVGSNTITHLPPGESVYFAKPAYSNHTWSFNPEINEPKWTKIENNFIVDDEWTGNTLFTKVELAPCEMSIKCDTAQATDKLKKLLSSSVV